MEETIDGESDALISSTINSYWLCNDATNNETYPRKKSIILNKHHLRS